MASKKVNTKVEVNDVVCTLENKEITIKVKKYIGLQEVFNFVKDATDICFQSGLYVNAFKDASFKIHIIKYFTDLKIASSLDNNMDLLYGSDVYYRVIQYVNQDQLIELERAVNEQTDYRKQLMIKEVNNVSEDVLVNVSNTIDNANNFINNFSVTLNKVSGFLDKLNAEDAQKFISQLSNLKIDEKNLVQIVTKIMGKSKTSTKAKEKTEEIVS